ncbi:MAG: hypothetical protein MJ147_08585 [Clostridia bacterium]|nr:hypothetical protein [Clostridia bacterium]
MRKVVTKIVSVLLSIIIALSVLPVCFAQQKENIPLIYVCGQGAELRVKEEDGSERKIYPLTLPDGFIEATVKENLGIFAKAVVTQQWDEFCDVIYNVASDLYSEVKLDENGRPTDNSRPWWNWRTQGIRSRIIKGAHRVTAYDYYYDWRLDPYEIAEDMHDYIEAILAKTGKTQVSLCGRCLGACIITAYMEKYDGEYVRDLVYYASALDGATQVTKAFCGELYIDADSVERFLYDYDVSADQNINQLLRAFVTLYNDTYGLDIACWSINNVYPKIYLNIVPRLMVDTLGTFPGYWSMVSDNDYEKAKETVFYGADMEKYEHFIEIIDNYHYNVQCKAHDLLKEYEARGITVSNIVKYGYQTYPITADGDILSDDICDVYSASMGATTAPVAGEFNKKYLAEAAENGTDIFISPDKQIDASTCLFPERTWFIKNLEHKNFPNIVDNLIDEILSNEDYTIFSDEKYPQYLVFNNTEEGFSLVPMIDENKGTDEKYKVSFFKAIGNFFKSLYNVIKNLIQAKIDEKKGTVQ